MKHLLNNLSEEEKNSIREQHEGGMKLDTSRFRTLLEGKSGNVKPLVEQEDDYPKINLRKHFDKERELNPDLMGDDEWDEFNNSFEDKDIEIYNRKRFDKERELEEDFEGDDSEDEGYEEEPNEEIFNLIDDECINLENDDECVTFLNMVIEYCEDKLNKMGQYGGSDEEEDLGDFEGDDSEDEEELGESSSLSSNRGLEKLIEKHSLDQILALFDNDEDSIDELMSTFEPLGITSYDELVDYKGEDSEYEEEDLGFAQHDGDFGGDDSEDEEELDLTEFDDLDEDETW